MREPQDLSAMRFPHLRNLFQQVSGLHRVLKAVTYVSMQKHLYEIDMIPHF